MTADYNGYQKYLMIKESLETLAEVCHREAKGWWIDPLTGENLKDNPFFFPRSVMMVVTELAEAIEGDRKDAMDDKLPHRKMREVELADAVIRIFDLAAGYDMDLAGAIIEKMAFNAEREDHKLEHRLAAGGKKY